MKNRGRGKKKERTYRAMVVGGRSTSASFASLEEEEALRFWRGAFVSGEEPFAFVGK